MATKVTENKLYYAKKYMMTFTKTSSLNKLEAFIIEKPLSHHREPISAYIYYLGNEVNKYKHPHLYELKQEFKKYKDMDSVLNYKNFEKNKYRETEDFLDYQVNKNKMIENVKKQMLKDLKETISKMGISISQAARISDTQQSNLYEFIVNEKLEKMSTDAIQKTIFSLENEINKNGI